MNPVILIIVASRVLDQVSIGMNIPAVTLVGLGKRPATAVMDRAASNPDVAPDAIATADLIALSRIVLYLDIVEF